MAPRVRSDQYEASHGRCRLGGVSMSYPSDGPGGTLAERSATEADFEKILGDVIETAIAIAHADFGDIELLDARTGRAHIVAARGFPEGWLQYWQAAVPSGDTCDAALEQNARAITGDVLSHMFDVSAREGDPQSAIQAVPQAAGVRAVQSTPLISRAGRMLGRLSTHYQTSRTPSTEQLRLLDLLARQAADIIDHLQALRARADSEAHALQASETRYRGLVDQVPEGILVADAQGRYTDANQAACDMLGYSVRELQTLTVKDVVDEREWDRLRGQIQQLRDGQIQALRSEGPFRRKDGSTFVGTLLVRQLADGCQSILRDVTDEKKVEAAMHQLEAVHRQDSETLRALLTTAAQGILEFDEQGIIRSANPAVETIFGWSPGELVGQRHTVLIPTDRRADHEHQHYAAYWAAPRARAMGMHPDLVAQRKDGTTLPVEVSLAPITKTQGRSVFAFVTDISARRREEDARAIYARELERQSDQLRALATALTLAEQRAREELSRTLHDGLQQSLFGVKMKLERAEQRMAEGIVLEPEVLARARQELQEAITEARSLAVELAPPMLHDSGLPAALTWLAGWVQQRHGLAVTVVAEPDANPLSEDVRTLAFISVRELLFNIAKHAHVDRATVEVTRAADEVQVRITDTGVGFDPDNVSTTSPGQARLGLLGVRERLRLLGGRLDIDSARGGGTRATIRVPRAIAASRSASSDSRTMSGAAEDNRAGAAGADRPLQILIADDHASVREALRELLTRRPELRVIGEVSDGYTAVEQAHALRPDVVIMDVSMPGLGGVDATRRLRADLPHVQVLALSSHARPDDGHPIEAAGACFYFCKGDDTQLLIARLLSIHRAQASSEATV